MAKLATLLASCCDLKSRLPRSKDPAAIDAVLGDLEDYIQGAKYLSQKSNRASPSACHEIDQEATGLWNLTTKLRREDEARADVSKKKLLLQSRVFAFQVIDIVRRASRPDGVPPADLLHLLKLALKVGKSCLDEADFHLAMVGLSKAAEYVQQLHDRTPPPEYAVELGQLEAEYFILRTAQSWKDGRLDVAEHMFRKAGGLLTSLDAHAAENLADVLFEIGQDFSKNGEFEMAVKWLERAYEVIDGQDLEQLSRHGVELRLAVLQSFIHALVGTKDPENVQKATDRVAYIESDLGDKPVILLLRLELLETVPQEEFDVQAYGDILHRMTVCFNFSESHFKFMMHHARRLHGRNPVLACSVMDELLTTKILASEREEWIERVVVLRVWMATSQSSIMENILELEALLAKVLESMNTPLNVAASVAAQSLIWKRVESSYGANEFDAADNWCRLANHDLFKNSGLDNHGRIERKRILCAISRNDYEQAKAIFHEMTESSQAELMTRYLMFKVAVRGGDHDVARECLEVLSGPSEGTLDYLYACVLDAQQVGDRQCAAEAMKSLVERHDFKQHSVHLPALLRCTLRLLCSNLSAKSNQADAAGLEEESIEDDICRMFESGAIENKAEDDKGHKLFIVKELDWFSQNAYNLGLQHCETWGIRNTLRIFNACLSIITSYPEDIPFDHAKDLSLKSMCCNFVAAAALVSMARSHDDREEQLQGYLVMRKHVKNFDIEFQAQMGVLDEEVQADLLTKLATLLVFDFEGAVALRDWDGLREIVEKSKLCQDSAAYKAMADCLLRASETPGQVLFTTMRVIINELWSLDNMDLEKIAKYIRCLFRAVLHLESGMAFHLLDEALQLAREAVAAQVSFPDEELEWLATMSWNHAIDLYAIGKDEECKKWAMKAINLAHYCEDEGVLERQLQDKFSSLKWEKG